MVGAKFSLSYEKKMENLTGQAVTTLALAQQCHHRRLRNHAEWSNYIIPPIPSFVKKRHSVRTALRAHRKVPFLPYPSPRVNLLKRNLLLLKKAPRHRTLSLSEKWDTSFVMKAITSPIKHRTIPFGPVIIALKKNYSHQAWLRRAPWQLTLVYNITRPWIVAYPQQTREVTSHISMKNRPLKHKSTPAARSRYAFLARIFYVLKRTTSPPKRLLNRGAYSPAFSSP